MIGLRRLGTFAAFALVAFSAPVFAQPLREVSIGLAGSGLLSGLPTVAKQMGLFEKHGIDAKLVTLDLIFTSDSNGWKSKPLTVADMMKEIALLKANGVDLPNMDRLDPASMIFP